uniref:Uncharacterized protein n=1 Tax=Caenorhabditis japonica TaxID=281687 RepID=A0A8R1IXF9_CAEJA
MDVCVKLFFFQFNSCLHKWNSDEHRNRYKSDDQRSSHTLLKLLLRKMRAILYLVLLVAISWTLLDVVDSKGVPAKRVKRQYYGGYGYGGYGYGGGCNCATYAPCPHGES